MPYGASARRADQLLVDELLDAHVAEFAAVAGVLDAAERQFGVGPVDVVDEHHAGVDPARHALAARDILGEDRAAQAEVGIVGQRDGRVLVLDPEEHGDRAEELVAEGGVVRLDVSQDRRLHVGAGTIDPLAADQHLRALGDGCSTCFEQLHQGRFAGKRTQRRLLVHRVAGLQRAERRLEPLQELVGELVDDDESLGRAAGLAGIVHPAPDRPGDGVVEVGVLEHDEGVAAAKLHRRDLEVLAGARGDALGPPQRCRSGRRP